MLVELSPDVVLITHLMHHSPGYVAVAHDRGIPVVLELHDFYMLCPRAHLERRSGELCAGPEGGSACARHCFGDQESAELRWALRARSFGDALRGADEVIAPSEFLADAFAPTRGDGSIGVVANAVAPFGPGLRSDPEPDAPLRLASIGVTVEHKGFQVVVEALRLAGLPRASYTVFGVALPPLATELQQAADRVAGLEFRLANGFKPTHLPVLLADVDVVVVPSLVPETYSIVVREAFSCGLPVIASSIGALPAAIRPDDNGWLFEPGDTIGLAELLRRLHHDRALVRRAAAGIRSDDVTGVAERTDRIEDLLKGVLGRHHGRPQREEGKELAIMREALGAELD
jgi:glycosyltransferase involved in cell wall biosynthesis